MRSPERAGRRRASVSAVLSLALCARRAAGKGCFLGSAEVTLADGSRRQLRDVREGDLVASWDEELRRPAASAVRAVPEFDRDRAELVEISLPGERAFHATVDHPFWSRGRGVLVSLHPNATREEYGLEAELMGPAEELEGERQEAVRVAGARRLRAAAGGAPALLRQSPADAVKVTTLCLHPHHWFYVHGVRVHNKAGCFMGGTAVTMADGTRRQLQDVAVGDRVASWDEEAQQPAASTVRAVPTYRRSRDELVEISLPSSTLRATADHPFWSRARRTLVSKHPNGTRDQYELDAELMSDTEEFEDERQEAVAAASVRRLQPRRLGLALAEGGEVEVMTLCLGPHHWFYAEGVRVHNKGCFAPWTPVVMGDGTQRPIAQVREGDRVVSWDSERGVTSTAEVLGLEAWPAGELMEVSLGPTGVAQARLLEAVSQSDESESLVVTPDHPLYSVRHGGLVSMRPDHTKERYALSAAQMQTRELLHHHLNGTVAAEVRGVWKGLVPDKVITLRLDRHHWFYAQGVRVHNKGSSSGSSGGRSSGGIFGGGGVTTRSRATMGVAAYMSFILMSGGSRRRYGTYNQEDGRDGVQCTMKSEAEVEAACMNLIGGNYTNYTNYTEDYCFPCIACESTACVEGITATDGYDCTDFLGEAFSECTEEEDGDFTWLLVVVGIIVGMCCCVACFKNSQGIQRQLNSGLGGAASQLERKQASRETMPAFNGPRLGRLFLSGKYCENRDEKPTSYTLDITPGGTFSGSSTDDDGTAVVQGKIYILNGETDGNIAWCETRQNVHIEASGIIDVAYGRVVVRASYVSSFQGTQGSVEVSDTTSGFGLQQGQVINGQPCAGALHSTGHLGNAQVVPSVVGQVVGIPTESPPTGGAWRGLQNRAAHQGEGKKS